MGKLVINIIMKNDFNNYEFLYTEYIIKEKTYSQIAKEIGFSLSTISKWVKNFKIDSKKREIDHENKKIYLNKKYGKLMALEFSPDPKINERSKYHDWIKCNCDCGNVCIVSLSDLKHKNKKSCGCSFGESGEKSKCFTGYKEISGKYFSSIKRTSMGGSNKRKRLRKEFDITIEYIWDLFIKQEKKCALSGLSLKFSTRTERNDGNCSLDRVDSDKGYIKGNVQWVHKNVNIMKNKFKESEFINLCKLIACKNN
jgi:hypothetical protein